MRYVSVVVSALAISLVLPVNAAEFSDRLNGRYKVSYFRGCVFSAGAGFEERSLGSGADKQMSALGTSSGISIGTTEGHLDFDGNGGVTGSYRTMAVFPPAGNLKAFATKTHFSCRGTYSVNSISSFDAILTCRPESSTSTARLVLRGQVKGDTLLFSETSGSPDTQTAGTTTFYSICARDGMGLKFN